MAVLGMKPRANGANPETNTVTPGGAALRDEWPVRDDTVRFGRHAGPGLGARELQAMDLQQKLAVLKKTAPVPGRKSRLISHRKSMMTGQPASGSGDRALRSLRSIGRAQQTAKARMIVGRGRTYPQGPKGRMVYQVYCTG